MNEIKFLTIKATGILEFLTKNFTTMKTAENMTMSEMINFDREVVNYINHNREYINDADDALDHYKRTVEAFNDAEEFLSKEQEERFLNVAKRLFSQGYVEHAGVLSDR